MLHVGDRIYYQKNNVFYVDRVTEVVIVDGSPIYSLKDYDWQCVTEDEILDETDERVRDYMCLEKDAMVKLSDVRSWLRYHARNYYGADEWSEFKDDDMIKDLCKAMLYNK